MGVSLMSTTGVSPVANEEKTTRSRARRPCHSNDVLR